MRWSLGISQPGQLIRRLDVTAYIWRHRLTWRVTGRTCGGSPSGSLRGPASAGPAVRLTVSPEPGASFFSRNFSGNGVVHAGGRSGQLHPVHEGGAVPG